MNKSTILLVCFFGYPIIGLIIFYFFRQNEIKQIKSKKKIGYDPDLLCLTVLIWPIFLMGLLGEGMLRLFDYIDMTTRGSTESKKISLNRQQQEQVKEIEETDPLRILFEIENQELKTSLIKKHGFNNLIEKTKYEVKNQDDYGALIKIYNPHNKRDYYFVKVINGTPEADGSFKDYYLQVPPDMDTAKEAVAWTYGLAENEYELTLRT